MLNLENDADLMRLTSEAVGVDVENDALLQCEVNPELWRRVALAFIEQRQLESALKDFAATDNGSTQPTRQSHEKRQPRSKKYGYNNVNVAVSACLFFALGASMTAIAMLDRPRGYNVGKLDDGPVQASPVLVYVRPPESAPVEEVREVEQDATATSEYKEIAQMMQPMINAEARALMRQSGIDVEEHISLYYVQGESGQPYAIPDRQIRFVQYKE